MGILSLTVEPRAGRSVELIWDFVLTGIPTTAKTIEEEDYTNRETSLIVAKKTPCKATK
jgi:hypothetical protein